MTLFTAPPVEVASGASVSAMIAEAAVRRPHHPALVCDGERLTWADFDSRVNQVANALHEAGLGHGDKVAVLSRNSPAYAEVFIGTIRAGGCIVPLSTMVPSAALDRMVVDSGARFMFLANETRGLAAAICRPSRRTGRRRPHRLRLRSRWMDALRSVAGCGKPRKSRQRHRPRRRLQHNLQFPAPPACRRESCTATVSAPSCVMPSRTTGSARTA